MQNGAAADEWLTLAEAAARVGISVDTLRRRIKRGELEHRIEPTAHGPAYRVSLGSLQTVAPTVGSTPTQVAQAVDTVRLLDLVDKLQQQNLELAGRLGFLQAELQQRDEQLLALQAPKQEEDAPVDLVERPRPSWWRRWLLSE